jgi:hypothetical protein
VKRAHDKPGGECSITLKASRAAGGRFVARQQRVKISEREAELKEKTMTA